MPWGRAMRRPLVRRDRGTGVVIGRRKDTRAVGVQSGPRGGAWPENKARSAAGGRSGQGPSKNSLGASCPAWAPDTHPALTLGRAVGGGGTDTPAPHWADVTFGGCRWGTNIHLRAERAWSEGLFYAWQTVPRVQDSRRLLAHMWSLRS